jgi:hypothetical protein
MVINEFTDKVTKILGEPGHMMSYSKTGYREARPRNFAVFNGNVFINGEKVWYGDIDLTISGKELNKFSVLSESDIYVLYEQDGRFENEDKPKLMNAAAVYKRDGTVTYQKDYEKYYDV